MLKKLVLVFIGCIFLAGTSAQRSYAPHSVLATGAWFRIGIGREGVYKVDVPFLSALGVNTASLASATIRLYGNGGAMVPENNSVARGDDLVENAIDIVDGGDGILNGNDYFLFYAPGVHRWQKDSLQQRFRHQKNLYGDTAFYYLNIAGAGKRIRSLSAVNPAVTVTSYNDRYFYENDLVNLASSGKEWYGEGFNTIPGAPVRAFNIDWTGLRPNQPVTLISDLASRSVSAPGSFSVSANGQPVQSVPLAAVSGNFLEQYASTATQENNFVPNQGTFTIQYNYASAAPGALGWLNWFELHGRRSLAMVGQEQLLFRDWLSVHPGSVAAFQVSNTGSGASVWDVTEPLAPIKMVTSNSNSQTFFNNDVSRLREYVAFTTAGLLAPFAAGTVSNQDLHNSAMADYIIITHPALLAQAQQLAQFHTQQDGLRTIVVTTTQVYNEFGGGLADPGAIRDFVKMYYDKAGGDSTKRPAYLLLFGSASYDYRYRVSGNTNLVPCFESNSSLDPLTTYTSDDFFGLLDDTDDINRSVTTGQLDIGVGRIPARNAGEATIMVNKIMRYAAKESLGEWRNDVLFVADDRDNGLHLNDAETLAASTATTNQLLNLQKIYLDAYPLVSSSGGARYPAVNDAIVNGLGKGALIFNYSGHGSYQRLADEAVVTQDEVNRLDNPNKLPLFITASCDFYPFEDPLKNSLGELTLTGSANGAIALLTTTRLVFASSNRIINDNYLKIALQPGADGRYLTLGESIRRAKNVTVQGGDVLNTRKFALLGDPALRLAIPRLRVNLATVNGQPLSGHDTLRALAEYSFTGEIIDAAGNVANDFNGRVYPSVFDQARQLKTLGNDPASPVTSYMQQSALLYKGVATVTGGHFTFSFIVPKDISFQPGQGRISLYAEDGTRDAAGVSANIWIGGPGAGSADKTGPAIGPYLNDTLFLNGGLTHADPLLLVKLSDTSGISTSGNGIGHDITLVIDGNERNVQVLNGYYAAEKDTYRRGTVRYQLPTLAPGAHTLTIRAWDVANNSSLATLDFMVGAQERLQVANLRNFPNPFTNSTTFSFEHNQPNTELGFSVSIYHSNGMLVKQISRKLNTGGTRNCQVTWDGHDGHGRKLEKGVYIYRVNVKTTAGEFTESRQLILL